MTGRPSKLTADQVLTFAALHSIVEHDTYLIGAGKTIRGERAKAAQLMLDALECV